MDASSVFAGWSDAQLRVRALMRLWEWRPLLWRSKPTHHLPPQEYINENGGSAAGVTDRAALVVRAVDTSHSVERKVRPQATLLKGLATVQPTGGRLPPQVLGSGGPTDTTARGGETFYPDVYGGAPPGSSRPPAAAPPQAARYVAGQHIQGQTSVQALAAGH